MLFLFHIPGRHRITEASTIDSSSSPWASWVTDPSEEPMGSWIRLAFDGAATVDKMVVANTCNDMAPIANVLLAFSDGSSQQVMLPNNCDAATVPLLAAVTTTFVAMMIQTRHPIPGAGWNRFRADGTGDSGTGLRMLRFHSFPPFLFWVLPPSLTDATPDTPPTPRQIRVSCSLSKRHIRTRVRSVVDIIRSFSG